MFGFFTPRYLKEARQVLKNAQKIIDYKRDILKPEPLSHLEKAVEMLRDAVKLRDRESVTRASEDLDKAFGQHVPATKNAGWRENTEVFVTAVVIALGVRTYFLQPFSIPTGSMQPTLNGMIGYPTNEPVPNIAKRSLDFAWFGRTYLDTVSKEDDVVVSMQEFRTLRFFVRTRVQCEKQQFTINAAVATLQNAFGLHPGKTLKAGQPVVRGHVDAGDSLFVDKISYHFRTPTRGQVFVFNTQQISYIERKLRMQGIEASQYYIKRLVGLPGDTLRIDAQGKYPPGVPGRLFVNDQLATESGIQKVMSGENGFRGYALAGMLPDSETSAHLPPRRYYAMGDNSYNSEDSRYWGTVPEENITGKALFVYWPFGHHFGFIK